MTRWDKDVVLWVAVGLMIVVRWFCHLTDQGAGLGGVVPKPREVVLVVTDGVLWVIAGMRIGRRADEEPNL